MVTGDKWSDRQGSYGGANKRDRAQLATRLNPSSAELSNEESRRVERTLRMLIPDNAGNDEPPHPGLRLVPDEQADKSESDQES